MFTQKKNTKNKQTKTVQKYTYFIKIWTPDTETTPFLILTTISSFISSCRHHMNLQFLFSRFIEKGLRNCRLYTRNPYYEVMLYTDNGQKYSHASNLPYIFHIKLQFFKILSWNQFTYDFNHYLSRKAERYVVYSSNFEITFWNMFFKSQWFKHRIK
jgi:hypothetical protein